MADDPSKQLAPTPPITTSGLQVGSSRNETSFKKGHLPLPGGGRPRGSPNRIKADLSQMIINNAARAGFLELKDGKPVATGIDGCEGYLLWCAVNKPDHYMALLARVLPYYVSPPEPVGKGILSYEETLARLRERGLPPELIDHMRLAPEILDRGEDPDPYGLMKDTSVPSDDTGK
jgi:hypothetical protein